MFNIITNRRKSGNNFDLTNFFQDIFPDSVFPNINNRMMKLDIKENQNNYEIEVELPGVNKENIDVSVADDILTISVNKTEEAIMEGTKYLKKERKYGMFKRSFSIPNIDTENISAQYNNGVLKITLYKKEELPQTAKVINIE